MKRRLLLIVLALGMLFTLLSVSAAAATTKTGAADVTVHLAGKQDYDEIQEVLKLLNKQRKANNLSPLVLDKTLTQCAMQRAAECALNYSHTRPNGESCSTVLDGCYSATVFNGENIAYGFTSAAAVMSGWMDSTGHRNNILAESSTHVGLGCFHVAGNTYWVQLFGKGISNQTNASTTGQSAVTAEVQTLKTGLRRRTDGLTVSMAATSKDGTASERRFSLAYVNPGCQYTDALLIPSFSDVTDKNGKVIARLSLANDGSGELILTAVANGKGTLDLPVYSGQTDPFVLTVNIHNHSYTATVAAPGCTEWGYTEYACSECDDSYTDNFTSPTGHTYGAWKIAKAPTTSSTGQATRACTACGKSESRTLVKLVSVPATFPFSDEEWNILTLVNQERQKQGLAPLTGLPQLQQAADTRVNEISNSFSHSRPNGTSCFTVLDDVNLIYGSAGENIARGYPTSNSVMSGWMGSAGHKNNILGKFDHLGIGNSGTFWTQLFAGGYEDLYTSFSLVVPNDLKVASGTTIEDMDIYAVVHSDNNGVCYLPILSNYCTGYAATTAGRQQVSVSVLGFESSFYVTVGGESVKFVDVNSGAYYNTPVLWAVNKGITNGLDATHFGPNAGCTRGQVVTFLWRAAGEPKPSSTYNPFVDVKTGAFYYDAVLWAVEKGITNGVDNTHFGPGAVCTRAQVVTFLWRYDGSPSVTSSASFTDVPGSSFYARAVAWAVKNGITNGTGSSKFDPSSTCTRAQVVTFLYRYMN